MAEEIKKILDFSKKLEEIDSIGLTLRGEGAIRAFQKKIKKNEDLLTDMVEDIKDQIGLALKPHETDIIFLTSLGMEWSRPEKYSKEGFLSGGFSFNGLSGLSVPTSCFWNRTTDSFIKYNPQKNVDTTQLSELNWIESQVHFSNGSTENFPYATCANKNGTLLPDTFFFYDSGLIFDLNVFSYCEYIEAMINSAAVTCWQYFYTNPKHLVDAYSNVCYFPWHIGTSDLADGINGVNYLESIKFDRLDLIAEYLERCVRLLPVTFPFLDFEHHKKFYDEFKRMYDKAKK
jgi:hypothetical protein